ncbi:MAG TPA: hypothetical protein VF655_02845 [Allosphingosinicella sp.]|jgi:hypothetical protein
MLRPLFLGTAMLFALPALAQTSNGTQSSGTATTTNDHDPTMEEGSATAQGQVTVGTQANGGVRSSQTTTTNGNAQGTAGTSHSGMNHGTMNQSTAGQAGTMSGGRSSGAMSGDANAAGTMSGGSMSGGGTMSGGSMSGGTMSGGSMSGASGVGGPLQAAGDYPPCTRTRTDSCIQTGARRRR